MCDAFIEIVAHDARNSLRKTIQVGLNERNRIFDTMRELIEVSNGLGLDFHHHKGCIDVRSSKDPRTQEVAILLTINDFSNEIIACVHRITHQSQCAIH